MDVPARRHDDVDAAPTDRRPGAELPDAIVTSHETRPGKVVFTERRNTDGWIATDLTVELRP